MISAAAYNRQALGKIWNLQDLPEKCPVYQVLVQGDLDHDLSLEPEELDRIDWIAFSKAVGDFQEGAGLAPRDAKLGPVTLRRLRESYGVAPVRSEVLRRLGEMVFRPAAVPVSEPTGPLLVGRTPEEKAPSAPCGTATGRRFTGRPGLAGCRWKRRWRFFAWSRTWPTILEPAW